MAEILRLHQVSKWMGENETRIDILRGVSLSFMSGEFVAIMGASGSGKSTLLNILGLLETPSSGSMRLLGQETAHLADDEQAALRARSIGFIFQSFNLIPYLTATENVELPMTYTHRDNRTVRSRDLLTRMNLGHRLSAYPQTLSGGERQRVAIARSLANEPALILADEPTGALDSSSGTQVMELLSGLHRSGVTVVMVTHDENIARRAQRILRMKDGRLVA